MVSKEADRPWPAGSRSSQERSVGADRSGAGFVSGLIPARIRSPGSEKPWIGAPATTKSASATRSGVASTVDRARASGPIPSAIARATASVLPHSDS
ncbi:MAG: hypothetical protein C0498_03610 [Anaerolinea sp.]|nr:hypothetical protein [Anaerolinea sp.]